MHNPATVGFPVARGHRERAVNDSRYDIAIIGGGPAGSTAAVYLARAGFRVCIMEKSAFPRETLCGEFFSREVVDILEELQLSQAFLDLHPNPLTSFRYFSDYDYTFSTPLRFSAYGIKRGTFDQFMLENARKAGATVYQPATVKNVRRSGDVRELAMSVDGGNILTARYVIGAFGKHALQGTSPRRELQKNRIRLNGIKFHVPREYLKDIPEHEIQIYTAPGVYCGLSVVNDDTVTICFLEQRTSGDGKPRSRIQDLLKANGHFANAISDEFKKSVDSFPIYGAGDIYFGVKDLVKDGIVMIGDAARVIAPLAGDGISMAMQSARLAAEVLSDGIRRSMSDESIFRQYSDQWNSYFQRRLRVAIGIQRMIFSNAGRLAGAYVLTKLPFFLSRAIEYTRG